VREVVRARFGCGLGRLEFGSFCVRCLVVRRVGCVLLKGVSVLFGSGLCSRPLSWSLRSVSTAAMPKVEETHKVRYCS
jgi:hypothetical protein